MEKKAIISFVAIVVTMLMVIPLAFGAIGSVTIRDNEITFTEVSNGGISSSGKQIKQNNQQGHIAFRIQNDLVTDNVIPVSTKTFQIVLPGEVYICIMVETATHNLGNSWINMTMQGTGYTAYAPKGGTYYFSVEHRNGNTLLPMNNLNDVEFMKLDQETIIDCEGHRSEFSVR